MQINVLTLFPEMFRPILQESILKRAQEKNLVKINIYNLRDWAIDKHKTVDDTPFGGGVGMILKADVVDRALYDFKSKILNLKSKIILLTPKGKRFNQQMAQSLSHVSNLLLICGHYGGFDERIRSLADTEISLGDFILTGGELPAMAVIDTVSRLIPGVINAESLHDETHSKPNLIQYPQYTRPEKFKPKSIVIKKTLDVPKMLLSGHHELISKWRQGKMNIDR